MGEQDFSERLQEARERAGFKSPREAAQQFGWNENTYKSRENGQRGIPKDQDQIRAYARAFSVPFMWLLTGQGESGHGRARNSTAPVMGFIGAGAQIDVGSEQVPPGGFYDIDTIIPLPTGAVGFEVRGDSMEPRYAAGDVVVVMEKGQRPEEIIDGTEVAVELDDGLRYLKRIYREPAGTYTLQSHNAPPIYGVRLTWVSDVLMMVPARKWAKITNGQRKPRPSA